MQWIAADEVCDKLRISRFFARVDVFMPRSIDDTLQGLVLCDDFLVGHATSTTGYSLPGNVDLSRVFVGYAKKTRLIP